MGWKIVFLILFFLIVIPIISSEITGEVITGKALTQNVAMNITIIEAAPSLSIISPENKTYLTNQSILLDYSADREQAVWYNIDGGANTTITNTDFLYFSTSQGSHILRIYANNTEGITNRSITFVTNSSYYNLYYTQWQSSTAGSSTNFSSYAYEDLQNLSNIIFEDTRYGRILFNQTINLTDDADSGDGVINLDDYINFSFNRIEINTEYMPNLNKSANLSISGLSYTNPRIAMNGQVCPSSICTKQSYSGGTLIFSVTHFTSYSAEETPSGEITTTGSGDNILISPESNLDIDTDTIDISLKQGRSIEKQVIIRNIGNQLLKINLDSSKINEFVDISEKSFELKAGESKKVILEFIAKEDIPLDLYQGKIIVIGGDIIKEISVKIEVESAESLFDVSVEIPERHLYVSPDKEFRFFIDIFEVEKIGLVDVGLDYIIKDEDGRDIFSQTETISIDGRTKIERTILIPKETKKGKYALYIRIKYNGEIATASSWFNVGKKSIGKTTIFIYVLLVIIIVMMIGIIYEIRKIKKYLKHHKRVDESRIFKKIGRKKDGT